MKRSMLVLAMALALAMSTMAGALAEGHGSITSPSDGEMIVADTLQLRAFEPDADPEGVAAWAVRSAVGNPDCDSGTTPDLAGWNGGLNQDDVSNVTWDGSTFTADIDVTDLVAWPRGDYCFAFNPEPFFENRDSVVFTLATPSSKDACKDGGWMTFGDYKNQGQCVSEFARMK